MTLDEYQKEYPQSEVTVTEHDALTGLTTTRTMTDDEYAEWCLRCLEAMNSEPAP